MEAAGMRGCHGDGSGLGQSGSQPAFMERSVLVVAHVLMWLMTQQHIVHTSVKKKWNKLNI